MGPKTRHTLPKTPERQVFDSQLAALARLLARHAAREHVPETDCLDQTPNFSPIDADPAVFLGSTRIQSIK